MATVKSNKSMTPAEAAIDLKRELKELEQVHGMILGAMEKLNTRMDVLRRNIEILQDAFIQKNAIPINGKK